MTRQQAADAYLDAWQQLRARGVAPELRLPVIDALIEMERAKRDSTVLQFYMGTVDCHFYQNYRITRDNLLAGRPLDEGLIEPQFASRANQP